MVTRIAIAVMALALAGCGDHNPLRPYRKWADYCMEMSKRKRDPEEGLRCLEAAERGAEEHWGK